MCITHCVKQYTFNHDIILFCNFWKYQTKSTSERRTFAKWTILDISIRKVDPVRISNLFRAFYNPFLQLASNQPTREKDQFIMTNTENVKVSFAISFAHTKIINLTLKIYSPISVTCLCEPLLDKRGINV